MRANRTKVSGSGPISVWGKVTPSCTLLPYGARAVEPREEPTMVELSQLQASGSVVIAADAETLYDMVADVTRMGEWSPACTSCAWDEGASAEPGSWFTGQNQLGDFKY